MVRSWVRSIAVVAGFVAAAAGAAHADPASTALFGPLTAGGEPGQRIAVDTPREMFVSPAASVSPTIYLERCVGGCMITKGTNDARINSSSIPTGPSEISEFQDASRETGAAADDEWNQIVQCVREVYSPYSVTVTDVKPGAGASYHEAIVAGSPQEIGITDKNVLGLAPLSSDCSAIDNVISFSFANNHGNTDRVNNICWTASQESAHAFGLDHEYSFTGNRSACNDPMTYRTDCGGEKFFRNEFANCGETATRACHCGALQNSHVKLLSVFGMGSPITGNPTVMMLDPTASGGVLGPHVSLQAGAKRGVARVELYLNGYNWTTVDGARFGVNGQPDPSGYSIPIPADVPNSIIDVKTIAYDDLGSSTESPVITVTKGAPCTTADTCATGQKCEAGKCFWDPPSGEIGDSCTYKQSCKSGLCTGTAEQQICTQSCTPGAADACPNGLDCIMQTTDTGVCFFQDTGGGCCSVPRGGGPWWAHAGIAAVVLGLVTRRRRRR
jgi:hypothetical protein